MKSNSSRTLSGLVTTILRNRQLLMYGVIGALSSSLDFVVYSLLMMSGCHLLIANITGVNIGIITSFCLNRRYNFKVTDRTGRRFIYFYSIGLIGLAISTGMLYLLVDHIGYNEFYSKLATIIIVALIQFALNKAITFRRSPA